MYYHPYIFKDGMFSIMPVGLPDDFYPTDKKRIYATQNYIICFKENISDDAKDKIIKEYAEFYEKHIKI